MLASANSSREHDDIDHINYLISVFKDKRYIKICGKPYLLFLSQMISQT